MRLFKVVNYTDATHYQLEPTGETFTDTDAFVAHATSFESGDRYTGKWQLQGKTESAIITFEPVTQCKLLIDETEGAETTDK